MSYPLLQTLRKLAVYPESDGMPMADNSKQFRWIFVIYGNLAVQYRDATDVYVGGNMFWYPVEGHVEIVQAPDVFVVFGRPKEDRSSYRQWEEGDVPLTVVFEIRSPNNDWVEMDDKLLFYEDYGVEEYYLYDPDRNRLQVYIRRGELLLRVRQVEGFISPRLGIRFNLTETELIVSKSNGQRFLSFEELEAAREQAAQQAEQSRQQAEQFKQQAEHAEQRVALLSRLVELSSKARRQQATPDELAELDRLEKELGR